MTLAQLFAPKHRTVLAHGIFDLLHLGHVRYLEEARRQGDELVVSVTSDRFASKGPGRPVFTQEQRAEMVGALGCVDRVVISDHPTAVEVIREVRPQVYVKGAEYEHGRGEIDAEIAEVEAQGGRTYFAHTPTMSSSALINGHVVEPALRDYLASAKARGYATKIPALIESMKDLRVLFVGETITDEYCYVSPLGKPAKEFIVCGQALSREVFAGGVIAASRHAAPFVKSAEVISTRTVRKTRFVDHDTTRKLFEIYDGELGPLDQADEAATLRLIERQARKADVVVVTDFGHGMMTPAVRGALEKHAKFLAVNTQTNAGNHGFNLVTKYGRADYVCLDAPEAQLAVGERSELMPFIATRLALRIDTSKIAITHGRRGCYVGSTVSPMQVPAVTTKAIDTMGAGDAFFAVTAPLASVCDDMEMVGFVGNVAGAIKVGIVGHRQSVDKATLLRYAATLLK